MQTPAVGRHGSAPPVLPALWAALPAAVAIVGAVGISLAAAQAIGLSERATASWLLVQFGLPGVLGVALTRAWRQPLLFIPNTTGIVLLGSLGGEVAYPALVGATGVAGLVVLLASALGLTARLGALVPAPVVFGVIAGAVLPFVVALFDALDTTPAVVGGMVLAYVLGRRAGHPRLPPIALVLGAGLVLAGLTGRLAGPTHAWTLPAFAPIRPVLSLEAVATVVPVLVPLIVLQANLAAVVFLRGEGYRPPARSIDAVSGAATAAAAAGLGAVPVSLAGFVTPLIAGPEAGDVRGRHRAAYASGAVMIAVAVASPLAAEVPAMVPPALLAALVGLAMLGVLGQALGEVTRGRTQLGPLVAFAAAASGLELLGLGPIFWALVLGVAIAFVLDDRPAT
ncbi:MAG: benzoate transporter [Thermomicrobiales bacterium]|nr:benzoate transporter [Thermomicrobiales bacterium]